jgi:hypothetical protein
MMTLEFHCASDTGRARSNNEDSAVIDEATALLVLADGMGGYNAGEVASGMCTSFIKTELGRWLAEASESATDTDVRRAMDICVGVKTLVIAMRHTTALGAPKVVERCTLPITSIRPADWIVTELGTFRCASGSLTLVELAPGVTAEEVRARTAARFEVRLGG